MRIYCGNVNEKHLNKTIELNGWIKRKRKLGSLLFIDLYDITGIVQIVINENNKLFDFAYQLSKESVINIKGKVTKRVNPNNELATGKYEIIADEINLISEAENTPFVIDENTDANEDIRLKYRYLDLRRKSVKDKILLRSRIIQSLRNFLIDNEFNEIETPFLCRPTPEGAKDYLVPTRNKLHSFFALPQSPQTFKQLLMVSGFDKYFQIARCFRDEQLRSDRQPEFTQLDMELSFTNELEIQTIIEKMIESTFKKVLNKKIKTPFIRLNYDDAMNLYGTDKPDIRFECILNDANDIFKDTKFNIFKSVIENKGFIKYLCLDKINIDKSNISKLEKYAKDNKAKGLAWISIKDGKIIDGSIAKVIEPDKIDQIAKKHKIKSGTILFVADKLEIANKSLGAVRSQLVNFYPLVKEDDFKFLWIVNWPLYEFDEQENKYVAAHHPFTSPTNECLDTFDKDKKNAKARSYDIVLNGYEIGGGSIRIHSRSIQERMFKSLNISQSEINDKFGFLLEAFKYGVPIHGGIAIGLDRLMMIITNSNSIKDVIAFPKNSTGNDLMLEGPAKVNDDELKELSLSLIKN